MNLTDFFKILPHSNRCYIIDSKNTCPYINLAIESVLFKHLNVSESKCVFVWRNQPSVIIGRFQNLWEECDTRKLRESSIKLCRRESGGGAVYHDEGNINFTFYSKVNDFNRQYDMNLLSNFLNLKYGLNTKVTATHDIVIDDYFKISGSSARIVKEKAYHHCTLLSCADLSRLGDALSTKIDGIESCSTKSIRMPVKNLFGSFDTDFYFDMLKQFSEYYSRVKNMNSADNVSLDSFSQLPPNIFNASTNFASWEWIYGSNPEFKFVLPGKMFYKCIMTVKNAHIKNVSPPVDLSEPEMIIYDLLTELFFQCPFTHDQMIMRVSASRFDQKIKTELISAISSLNI